MAVSVGISLEDGWRRIAVLEGRNRPPRMIRGQSADAGEYTGNRRSFVSVPPEKLTMRRVTLPVRTMDQAKKALRFQAERFVQGQSIEDLLTCHHVINDAPGGMEILLSIAPKDSIEGIKAKPIPFFLSLINIAENRKLLKKHGKTLIIAALASCYALIVLEDSRILVVRRIPKNGSTPITTRIIREARNTLLSCRAAPAVERIVYIGQKKPGLNISAIEEEFQGKAEIVEMPGEDVLAYGAALQGFSRSRLQALMESFEQEKAGYQLTRVPLILMFVFLLVWIGMELFAAMGRTARARDYYSRLLMNAKKVFNTAVPGKKYKFTMNFDQTIANYFKKKGMGNPGDKCWESFLDFLNELTLHIPVDDATIIHSINFKGKRAIIRGEADDIGALEALAKSLEGSGKFTVRTPFRMRGRRGKGARKAIAFTIELTPRRM